jgi:phosphate uptake regulator
MKRKLIKQANQAYTITLPIDWIRKNGLDKNSEVDLNEDGNLLVVTAKNHILGKIVEIDADENLVVLRNQLSALYSKGIDEIRLKSKIDISSKIVELISSSFLGYALVEKKDNTYVIKDITGNNPANLEEIFKRVFQTILSFYEEAINDIFGQRKILIEDLMAKDHEINKFCWYLERAINKKAYSNDIDGRILFTYAFALEKIGDEIYRMWRTGTKNKVEKTQIIKRFVKDCQTALEGSFELYYQFNIKKVSDNSQIKYKMREEEMKLKKVDIVTAKILRHLMKITEESVDLTHLTLMKKL